MMSLEIERKFLVKNTSYQEVSFKKQYIQQGFLNSHKERVVRVRIIDEKGFLTIKGKSTDNGLSRYEWEREISLNEAEELMKLCEPEGIIEKMRYYHSVDHHLFEIDKFLGQNEGLLIAEVELNHPDEAFPRPEYLGEEVTGIEQYYNSNLSKNPFKNWHKKTSN